MSGEFADKPKSSIAVRTIPAQMSLAIGKTTSTMKNQQSRNRKTAILCVAQVRRLKIAALMS